MNILTPITVVDSMVGATTSIVAEDPTAAWTAKTYVLGEEVHLVSTHRVYRCALAGASTLTPDQEVGTRWTDMRPTNRWAPFDQYASTQATATTTLTYVVTPGFFNTLALYGLMGTSYVLTIRDKPAADPTSVVIYSRSGSLLGGSVGWYSYLFTKKVFIDKLLFTGIPLGPNVEVTLTIDNAVGQPVKLGMMVFGDLTPLIGQGAKWGGTQWGASAEPITYSYIKFDDTDGTVKIKKRHSATNMRCSVRMPRAYADGALAVVQKVLDVPVAWIATDIPGFAGLNVFGLGSGSLTYDNYGQANFQLSVKGLI